MAKQARVEPTCRSFELQPVPIPDGCSEVIALIEKTFTTKPQRIYIGIYIGLYHGLFSPSEPSDTMPVPMPDGCSEVIALMDQMFTTKLQWSYLGIYIELCVPESAYPQKENN
jgi:hypothetical protein